MVNRCLEKNRETGKEIKMGVAIDTKLFKELMERYNEYRAKWIAAFGNADGFDAWFTKQVCNK